MKNLIDRLMALQNLQGKSSRAVPDRAGQMAALRTQIPESFLRTFDRFVAREKKPVSIVRHGVCSECHLQIPAGIVVSLAFGQSAQQCGNCGRFLYLPEDESVFAAKSPSKPRKGPSRKEATVHAA